MTTSSLSSATHGPFRFARRSHFTQTSLSLLSWSAEISITSLVRVPSSVVTRSWSDDKSEEKSSSEIHNEYHIRITACVTSVPPIISHKLTIRVYSDLWSCFYYYWWPSIVYWNRYWELRLISAHLTEHNTLKFKLNPQFSNSWLQVFFMYLLNHT